jgi:Zn-dependent protease with chaperone function
MTTTLTAETADVAPGPPCAACGSALTGDERFVVWCRSCGWNAHPNATTAKGRGDRFQRKLNRAAEERLYQHVTQHGTARPSLDAARIAAYTLSAVVHLVTVALICGGVAMVLVPHILVRLLGVFLLLLAWTMRPRLGPSRKTLRRRRVLAPDAAPALHALCARIAAELGTAPPHEIVVHSGYNASYSRIGLRRRVVLTLGLSLWETVTPAEQLAILGHELGHGANGDSRRGLWISVALDSLEEWYHMFRPGVAMQRRHEMTRRTGRGVRSSTGGLAWLGEMFAVAVMAVLAETTLLLYRLLSRLTTLSGRRAEYRADELAARIAGPEATAGLMQALPLGSSATFVRQQRALSNRAAPRNQRGQLLDRTRQTDFWTDLREYVGSIPESERARRILVSQLDDSAVDAPHPPTHQRLSHVRQLPPAEPLIVLSADEWAAIDAELAPARAAIARDLT